MKVHSDTLKILRTRMRLSQEGLAEVSRVTKATISRIERGKAASSNSSTISRLAKALKVDPEHLTKPPEETTESDLEYLGYRTIKLSIQESTIQSFMLAKRRYGVSMFDQIEMAPLFFTILAEGSLRWRREKLNEIWTTTQQLHSVGRTAGHLAFTHLVDHVEEGAGAEQESIDRLDIFGSKVGSEAFDLGFDPSRDNPFADYLRHLATGIDVEVVELDPHGKGIWRTDDGMPEYTICRAELERIEQERERIGGGNALAMHAIKRGYALVKDIPTELTGEDAKQARVEWLIARIPHDERLREEARQKLLDDLVLDLSQIAGGTDA